MARVRRNKLYAVKKGKGGPRIYTTWAEAKADVEGFPGAEHKSFTTMNEAEDYLKAPSRTTGSIQHFRPPLNHIPPTGDPSNILGTGHPGPVARCPHVQRSVMEGGGCFGPSAVKREALDDDVGMSSITVKTETPDESHMPADNVAPIPAVSGSAVPAEMTSQKDELRGHPAQMGETSANIFPECLASNPQPLVPPPPPVTLSEKQQEVLQMVMSGQNVFFTGSAGTGKSILLCEIIAHCRARDSRWSELAITAATGIAGVNIGGCTLHSWAGIGLGKESGEDLAGKLLGQFKNRRKRDGLGAAVARWMDVRTLIVDEISMIDGALFDKLEYIARRLRNNELPFGGIQLVLSGDFCQLPPVPDHREDDTEVLSTFAFEARTWQSCMGNPVVLHQVFRQSEKKFVDMLEAIRFGRVTPEITAAFKALSRKVIHDDGIEPTELYPLRREADNANSLRLEQLEGPQRKYNANDEPGDNIMGQKYPPSKVQLALSRIVAPETVTLKIGAQVMLIKNMVQAKLVNGSIGRVIRFSTPRDAREREVDIAKTEDQARNPSQEPKYRELAEAAEYNSWPEVMFENGLTLLCIPTMFDAVNAEARIEATRKQVPLILAWALSIHKSQGQTLERVRVNLKNAFESGQVYVALSRARQLATLEVEGFEPGKVWANERVLRWMSQTMGIEVTGDNAKTAQGDSMEVEDTSAGAQNNPAKSVSVVIQQIEEDEDDDEQYWRHFD